METARHRAVEGTLVDRALRRSMQFWQGKTPSSRSAHRRRGGQSTFCSSRPVGDSNVGGAFVPRKNVAAQRRLPPSFRTAKRLQKRAVWKAPHGDGTPPCRRGETRPAFYSNRPAWRPI